MSVNFSAINIRLANALPKVLVGAAFVAAGVFGQAPTAQAAVVTKKFDFAIPSLNELYKLVIKYDDSSTVPKSGPPNNLANPGVVTPVNPADPGAIPTTGTPLLSAAPYTFIGYEILDISGYAYVLSSGALEGKVKYNPIYGADGGTNAEVVGVFNYLCGTETPANPSCPGGYPIDLIAHAKPDNLFNPGGIGLGFSATSLPSQYFDNYVSFGGFAFDVFEESVPGSNNYDTLDGPYQLFTVSASGNSGNGISLVPGDYAGCPGSCAGAIIPTPGPLPLLGVGAAFGYSRRIRKRIRDSKKPEVISAIN
jgi:hypothetical protein